ncbi:MAG: cell wall anchor protein [Muribaculaceae bacterium]
MNKRLKKIFLAVVLVCGTTAFAAAQGSVVMRAKLDSIILVMGKQTALHLEVSQDKDAVGHLVQETVPTLTEGVEVIDRPTPDTTDLGNNRIQINRDLIIQSFDSGVYVIPPFEYVVGRDTFRCSHLTLKVLPVNVDSMTTVHDFKTVEGVPFKLFDWLPSFIADYWWLYLLFLVLVAAALFVYFKWLRHGKLPLKPQPKPLSPFDEAMQGFDKLKERQLWQSGQEKAYYTELTDILRRYISRRFGVNAAEMTSAEIMSALRKEEDSRQVNDKLSEILSLADFVKFAKVRPLSDENETAFQRAVQYVEGTKPAPEPEEKLEDAQNAAEGDKKAANGAKNAPKSNNQATDKKEEDKI